MTVRVDHPSAQVPLSSEVHMSLDHQPGPFLADAEMRANRTTVTAGTAHDDEGPGLWPGPSDGGGGGI